METLKIVHVDLIPKINGGHVAIANLVKALAKRGHEVHLIRGSTEVVNRNLEAIASSDGRMYSLHYVKGYKTILDLPQSFRHAVNKLIKLDNKFHFDVIHAHTTGGFSITLTKKNDLMSKFILTLHGNQLFRALMLVNDVVRSPKTLLKSSYIKNIIANLLGATFYAGLETIAARKALLTIVPSNFDKLLLLKMHILREEKIFVIPNCIDDSFINVQSKIMDKLSLKVISDPVILFAGPLIPLKGVHYLFDTMRHIVSELPNAKLVLAGKGMLQQQVYKFCNLIPDTNIIYLGWVPYNEMRHLYSASNVLVHPSLYESCSLTIAEAMSLGVPVVAFNTAGIPEFVINGKTGLLAELGNSKDLASKILAILKDGCLAKKLSENGKEFAKKMFSPQNVAQKTEKVYKLIN